MLEGPKRQVPESSSAYDRGTNPCSKMRMRPYTGLRVATELVSNVEGFVGTERGQRSVQTETQWDRRAEIQLRFKGALGGVGQPQSHQVLNKQDTQAGGPILGSQGQNLGMSMPCSQETSTYPFLRLTIQMGKLRIGPGK